MKTKRPIIKSEPSLQAILDRYVTTYDDSFLETDPIKFPYRYKENNDRECVAFLAATFAFGNVKAIFLSLEKILAALGKSPYQSVLQFNCRTEAALIGIQHRWIRNSDLIAFFKSLSDIYRAYGTLEKLYQQGFLCLYGNSNIEKGMAHFSEVFQKLFLLHNRQKLSVGLSFLIPSPKKKSACKRMHLFLRWMVRTSTPDFGLWTCLSPSELLLPMDTHLARISRYIGLVSSKSKTTNWKTTAEATISLRAFDASDPIKYDFALSRIGILKKCQHRYVAPVCNECDLRMFCKLARNRKLH